MSLNVHPYHLNSHEKKLDVLSAVSKLVANQVGATGLANLRHIELRLSVHIVDTSTNTSESELEWK